MALECIDGFERKSNMFKSMIPRGMFFCFIPMLLLCFSKKVSAQNQNEQIRIAVADFTGPDPETIPVTETLFSWLSTIGEEIGDLSVERFNHQSETDIISEETISELADENVDLLISGSYDMPATRVQLMISALNLSGEPSAVPLNVYLNDDASFLLSELVPGSDPPDKIRFIANFFIGYYLALGNSNDRSWGYINRAIELEESVPDNISASAYSLRSMAYLGIGNPVSALEDANRAIELDSTNPLQHSFRGAALETMGDFEGALEAYSIVNGLDPEDAENLYNMSRMYLQLGDEENSLSSIDEAIRLSPDEPCYLNSRGYAHNHTQNYAAAVEDISRALELNPNYATGWANLACAQRQLGNMAEAIESFTRAVSFQEDQSLTGSYILDRGYCYAQLDDYEAAIDDYSEGIALTGGRASQHAYLGWLLMQTGDYETALQSLNTAIQQEPANPGFLCRRAYCNYRLRNLGEAVDDYTRAYVLDPESFDDYEYLGKASEENGDPMSAIVYFTAGIENSTEPAETSWLLCYRAFCYRKIGDYPSAIADMTSAVELLPEEPFMYFRLGESLYLADRDSEAVGYHSTAIEKGLGSDWLPGCLFQRGRSYIILGSYSQAIEDLTEALRMAPNYTDIYYFRGKAFYLSENYDGCLQDMQAYLQVGSDPELLSLAREFVRYLGQ